MFEHTRDLPEPPSRVVLLGGTGFVGRAVEERLRREGVICESLGRRSVDLLTPNAAEQLASRLVPTDALVVISAEAPCRDPSSLVRNVRMVESVCAALSQRSVAQVVYISSDAVYSDQANPVSEDSCRCGPSLHGAMHAVREVMLGHVRSSPVAILRPTLIYGASDPHNGYGPNRFRRQAEKGEPILLFGDGEECRDHVLVDDVAAITWLSLAHRSQGAINVATGHSHSFRAVAERVAACFERPVEIRSSPRQTPIVHRHFDVTQLMKAFPAHRMTSLGDGLVRVHARMKEGVKVG